MPSVSQPPFVPLPKPEDYMSAIKAARLMRHCRDVLTLPNISQRLDHIARLAESDKDFRRYFQTVERTDPCTSEADKGGPKAWLTGICIVLDAVARQNPAHPNEALEIWPIIIGPQLH